jgi:hypothetical protein
VGNAQHCIHEATHSQQSNYIFLSLFKLIHINQP